MPKKLKNIFLILFLFASGIGLGYILKPSTKPDSSTKIQDKFITFSSEVYDVIKQNYWEKTDDATLNQIYLAGAEKLTGQIYNQELKTKDDLLDFLATVLKQYDSDDKKMEFTATLSDLVLSNLKPFGRSRLYTKKMQDDLSNTVANVDPTTDQYQVLGIDKDATLEKVDQAYQSQVKDLDPDKDADKIAQLNTAKNTLSDQFNKNLYDAQGIQPSTNYQVTGDTLYLKINKFTLTTFEEMVNNLDKVYQQQKLTNLILDLRDNIGGNIDAMPYFLGPFIGPDQYAYQFFHQGDKTDFKTKIGWLESLVPYKKVVILINENSQSAAELMTATLKKYNVGVVVGTPTKGWGTVEKVFPLENQIDDSQEHSVFLVHSLTLRDDGQPIEGNSVLPAIDIASQNWQQELFKYYSDQDLVNQVANFINPKS